MGVLAGVSQGTGVVFQLQKSPCPPAVQRLFRVQVMGEGKRGATYPDSFLRGALFPSLSSGRHPSLREIWLGCPRTPVLSPVAGALTVRARRDLPKPRALRPGPSRCRGARRLQVGRASPAPPVPSAGRPAQRGPAPPLPGLGRSGPGEPARDWGAWGARPGGSSPRENVPPEVQLGLVQLKGSSTDRECPFLANAHIDTFSLRQG